MATKTKTQTSVAKFKIKSTGNFITFLKRFSSLPEKALLLELTPDSIKAKGHTPDRAVIKYSKMALADVLDGTVPAELVKIGIYDVSKIVNVFKHFGEGDEVFLDLKIDDSGEDVIATSLKFYTSNLKITVDCADLSLFTYISGDMLKRILTATKDGSVIEFPFKRDYFSKVNSLCGIDAANDSFHIKINEGVVTVKGKSFEYEIDKVATGTGTDIDFAFYNSHFGFIEQEQSMFHVGPDRMLVESQESTTIIIIAKVE